MSDVIQAWSEKRQRWVSMEQWQKDDQAEQYAAYLKELKSQPDVREVSVDEYREMTKKKKTATKKDKERAAEGDFYGPSSKKEIQYDDAGRPVFGQNVDARRRRAA